jgi:hypothetical protein
MISPGPIELKNKLENNIVLKFCVKIH